MKCLGQKLVTTLQYDEPTSPVESTTSEPGQLGEVDMGPYPSGRSGFTHIFTIIDVFSQYAVTLSCTNKPGEIPKLPGFRHLSVIRSEILNIGW